MPCLLVINFLQAFSNKSMGSELYGSLVIVFHGKKLGARSAISSNYGEVMRGTSKILILRSGIIWVVTISRCLKDAVSTSTSLVSSNFSESDHQLETKWWILLRSIFSTLEFIFPALPAKIHLQRFIFFSWLSEDERKKKFIQLIALYGHAIPKRYEHKRAKIIIF